jgi:hypothetical protein
MNKKREAAARPHGYLLPEEGYALLEALRDELFQMAGFVFTTSPKEESIRMEIRRSMLGQLFESYGLRVDEVLTWMEWSGRRRKNLSLRH